MSTIPTAPVSKSWNSRRPRIPAAIRIPQTTRNHNRPRSDNIESVVARYSEQVWRVKPPLANHLVSTNWHFCRIGSHPLSSLVKIGPNTNATKRKCFGRILRRQSSTHLGNLWVSPNRKLGRGWRQMADRGKPRTTSTITASLTEIPLDVGTHAYTCERTTARRFRFSGLSLYRAVQAAAGRSACGLIQPRFADQTQYRGG